MYYANEERARYANEERARERQRQRQRQIQMKQSIPQLPLKKKRLPLTRGS